MHGLPSRWDGWPVKTLRGVPDIGNIPGMGKNTSISLGKPFTDFAPRKVESGEFGSTSEVVREAMREYMAEDTRIEALRAMIQKSLESGPAGGVRLGCLHGTEVWCRQRPNRELTALPRIGIFIAMTKKNTSIALGERWMDYTRAQVAAGEFNSTSEVIRDALRLHEERAVFKSKLLEAIDEGLASPLVEIRHRPLVRRRIRQEVITPQIRAAAARTCAEWRAKPVPPGVKRRPRCYSAKLRDDIKSLLRVPAALPRIPNPPRPAPHEQRATCGVLSGV